MTALPVFEEAAEYRPRASAKLTALTPCKRKQLNLIVQAIGFGDFF
ncbi:MAG: hypothetical protein RIR95_802 [Pseudomonadota bacterium]